MRSATAAEVRRWARDRGLPVGSRGHIHQAVVDQFNRKHRVVQYTNTNPAFRTPENNLQMVGDE